MNRKLQFITISVLSAWISLGCSRESTIYPDPEEPAALVSTDDPTALPSRFSNQSVNRASVEMQLDGVSATSKALRLNTLSGANPVGSFNGAGTGNRALLGINGWQSRAVMDAEPITFDAKTFSGSEGIGASLQIDLKCDGTLIRVLSAAALAIDAQSHTSVGDGYIRFTASALAPIWLSTTEAVVDPTTSATLVPSTGTPVTLGAMLAKFPSACLKNGTTTAFDLPDRVSTNAILLNLGLDSTTTANSTFVRRVTVGSETYEIAP